MACIILMVVSEVMALITDIVETLLNKKVYIANVQMLIVLLHNHDCGMGGHQHHDYFTMVLIIPYITSPLVSVQICYSVKNGAHQYREFLELR